MPKLDLNDDDFKLFTKNVREEVKLEIQRNPDCYHSRDVKRVMEDDDYCHRFLREHKSQDKATKYLKEALEFRQEFKVNELDESKISSEIWKLNGMYPIGKDKWGRENLFYGPRVYKFKEIDTNEYKKLWVYWFETLSERNEKINVLTDATGAGTANVDFDVIRFQNRVYNYYPTKTNLGIVYGIPWILVAVWDVIKTFLSKSTVEKVTFVNKSSILDYINEDQIPVEMGGKNNYKYNYVQQSDRS